MAEKKDIPDDLIDALLANYEKTDDLLGKNGILEQLTRRVVERALDAEMTHHLGHEKHGRVGNTTGNTHNRTSRKTLKGKTGEVAVGIPRDRDGSFEPQLVEKHQTHWQGFDDQIISLYTRGMSVREIQGHLKELYHTDVSPSLIRAVTDAVAEDVRPVARSSSGCGLPDSLPGLPSCKSARFRFRQHQGGVSHSGRHHERGEGIAWYVDFPERGGRNSGFP